MLFLWFEAPQFNYSKTHIKYFVILKEISVVIYKNTY